MMKKINRITKIEQAIKGNSIYREPKKVKEYVKAFEELNIKNIAERSKGVNTVMELMGILTNEELNYMLSLDDDILEKDI